MAQFKLLNPWFCRGLNISKDYTVNKEEGLEHGRIEHRQMKSVVLSPEMLG